MWYKTTGRCSRIETVGYVLGASRCEYCLPLNLLLLFEHNPILISSPLLQARSNTADGTTITMMHTRFVSSGLEKVAKAQFLCKRKNRTHNNDVFMFFQPMGVYRFCYRKQ